MKRSRVPLVMKAAFSAWVILWAWHYAGYWGLENFLWFCDIGNFAIAVALWLESPLLFSWQAVSVLLIQILYTIDVLGRLVLGFHPIGGTEYLFDGGHPLGIRLLALFHVATPPLLIWALARFGYDRRALIFQTLTAWIVLPVCYFFTDPARDINWVRGPFDRVQTSVAPWLYLIACCLAYPLLIYLPTHIVLSRLCPRAEDKGRS